MTFFGLFMRSSYFDPMQKVADYLMIYLRRKGSQDTPYINKISIKKAIGVPEQDKLFN